MHKLNYERSPSTEAKLIVIKYFVSTNHIAVTRKKNKAVVPSYFVALFVRRY